LRGPTYKGKVGKRRGTRGEPHYKVEEREYRERKEKESGREERGDG